MEDLTLTFLGTGTSIGVPVIGCSCEVCQSEDPRNKRLRASVYVQTPETSFLIDTTPDLRTQCLRERITKVDAVVYTHQHSDHLMGFDDLRRFTLGPDATMPVYVTPECLVQLQAAFGYAFDKANWNPVYIKPVAQLIDGPFSLGETRLTPLEVIHPVVRTVGYMMERHGKKLLAYIPDCKAIPETTLELMEGIDTLIIDCLREKPHPTHMCLSESLEVKDRVQPRATWLTHISDQINHPVLEAELPSGVKIAYDGLRLSF